VKRWTGAIIVAVLVCLRILSIRASSPALLQDSDTNVLLANITQRNAPFSWFGGDWPLFNHFYRPVSTLAFEMDLRLYGHQAWGFGLTNALLCVICTLLLAWFLRELTDKPWMVATGTLVFGLMETGDAGYLANIVQWFGYAVFIGGLIRHRQKVSLWLPAWLVAGELLIQLTTFNSPGGATIAWLPGRTATVMTVFALAATACYARYERLSAVKKAAEPTPLDPPATRKTSAKSDKPAKHAWVWAVLSIPCVWLALASYEQAVMLPAVLLATAVSMRWQGYRVRWGWQAVFWVSLVAYLAIRHQLVPSNPSSYQLQQFRHGPGVWISIAQYTIPSLFYVTSLANWWDQLMLFPMMATSWGILWGHACDIVTILKAKLHWRWIVTGWGMGFIAYLPMAWLKQFEHYNYWPLALRSIFIVSLGWLAWDLALIAWSPQTRQAPPRRDPAPGSLPRP